MTDYAAVVLVDARGWLLLQERDEHPVVDPEKWSLSGGAVEAGETFRRAAVRELEEETGVRLADDDATDLGRYRIWLEPEQRHVTMGVFGARADLTDDDIDCREGRRIVFVDPATLSDLDLSGSASLVLSDLIGSHRLRVLGATAAVTASS